MSKFFCDADCELDYRAIDELGIELIKMPYTLDGQEFLFDCGRTTDYKGFFDKMRSGAAAKTQALNEYDYVQYFEPVFSSGEDVLYVSFSHKMSGTFSAMEKALEELKVKYPDRKCTVIDTENISMGAGIIVYYAAKLHNEGASDEEVVRFVEGFKPRVKTFFTVDDLVYLKRGGRLSSFKAGMGQLLGIKPIIGVKDGQLISLETVKGRKKALSRLISEMKTSGVDESYPVTVLSSDCDEDRDFTIRLIEEAFGKLNIWRYNVGPVVGCHCGPDTIGIIFVAKQ